MGRIFVVGVAACLLCLLQNCTIESNKGDGLRVRSSAEPTVSTNTVKENKGCGVTLKDSGGQFVGNSIKGNSGGGISAEGFYGVLQENSVQGHVR